MATNFLNFGPELDAIFADAKLTLERLDQDTTSDTSILAALAGIASALDAQTGLIKADVQLLSDKLDKVLAWATPPQAETGDLNLPSATIQE